MRCTSFKIQLAGEGVTSNDDFDHVYSWGTDVPRVQQILTDVYTHLELKLEDYEVRLYNPFDVHGVMDDATLQEVGNYALCGERCLFDQTNSTAILRATVVRRDSSGTRYPPPPLKRKGRKVPKQNSSDFSRKRKRNKKRTLRHSPSETAKDVVYIRVGKYDVNAIEEDDEDERVINVFSYNNVDVGKCDGSDAIEDWAGYMPDEDFKNARFFHGYRLGQVVRQIAKSYDGVSEDDRPNSVAVKMNGVEDGKIEEFTIKPMPLPREVHFTHESPPNVTPCTSKKPTEALVMFHDWTSGEGVLAIDQYVYVDLEWDDSHATFETWFSKTLRSRDRKRQQLVDYFSKTPRERWKTDVTMLQYGNGNIMSYSWTDHQEDDPTASGCLDGRCEQQLGRKLYIDVYIQGKQKPQPTGTKNKARYRLDSSEDDEE